MSGDGTKTGSEAEPTNPELINNLVSWAKSHGAYLNDNVQVYHSPDHGLSLRAKAPPIRQQSPPLMAQNAQPISPTTHPEGAIPSPPLLPAHSRIVSCPFTLSLSYLNALSVFPSLSSHSPLLPTEFFTKVTPKVVSCFFLIQQYLSVATSHWGPYIRSLPQHDEPEKLTTPLYYDESALGYLKGTNLLAAVKAREEAWRGEFERGMEVLDGCKEMKGCTWELYKWASTIFSSRSFVSSLIPEEVYSDILDKPVTGYASWREKIATEGPYPVLFPLLDVANHDPRAKVEWFVDANGPVKDFSLVSEDEVVAGAQVFNNYAPKGNTELLLGYGFCVPGNDDVALELRCPDDEKRRILELRRGGGERGGERGGEDGKWIFHVRLRPYGGREGDGRMDDFRVFEEGLIDTLSVLVANEREEAFLRDDSGYRVERNLMTSMRGFMARNTLCALSILLMQLRGARDRIVDGGKDLGAPVASFEKTAHQYRSGQLATLGAAIDVLDTHLARLKIKDADEDYSVAEWPRLPIVDVFSAFRYLEVNHPSLWDAVARAMAAEGGVQLDIGAGENKKPISARNCDFGDALRRGWNATLLCIWVWCVLMVHHSEANDLSDGLDVWLEDVLQFYNTTLPSPTDDTKETTTTFRITSLISLSEAGIHIRTTERRRVNRSYPACAKDSGDEEKNKDFVRKMLGIAGWVVGEWGFVVESGKVEEEGKEREEVIFVPVMEEGDVGEGG